jgi:hypothetical protein
MSEKWNTLFLWLGGIASFLIILGFFGIDVLMRRAVQGMKTHYILLSIGLLVSLGIFATGLYFKLSSIKITTDNVELRIRQWLDSFGLGTRKMSEPNCFFAFEVTAQTGIPIAVLRTKGHSHYITLASRIGVGTEHKAAFDKLSESEKSQFIRRVRLEAAKAKIAYSPDTSFETLTIEKRLPITNNFSEADLLDGIGEINFSAIIVLDTIASLLDSGVKQPSSTPDKATSPP